MTDEKTTGISYGCLLLRNNHGGFFKDQLLARLFGCRGISDTFNFIDREKTVIKFLYMLRHFFIGRNPVKELQSAIQMQYRKLYLI